MEGKKVKKRRILKSERGFTLVELGIVMAIIAILAAVAYPTYQGMRERAYAAEAKAAMQEVRVEAWAWHVEKGTGWPEGTDLFDGSQTKTVGLWKLSVYSSGTFQTAETGFTPVFEIKATRTSGSTDYNIYLGLDANGVAKFKETQSPSSPT
ncbi:MAG TPA: prepilin-type N-terminal cleavage/methylation domain-containing protein [Firmicutes bacterium]|nr:prepilin-type N-terminal cleavage/methylation domain-containing protein [Candidatus Fermentithermobacillaceae bacterium]